MPRTQPAGMQIKGFERTQWTTQHSRQVAVQKSRTVSDGRSSRTEWYTDYETGEHGDIGAPAVGGTSD